MLSWLKRRSGAEGAVRKALGKFELPTFPVVVSEAMQRLRDPQSSLSDVGELLTQDPGTSARLLGIANSTAYALRHGVRSVSHAASLLGRAELESLLLSVAVSRTLSGEPTPGFDFNRFWATAARRAAVARLLASELDPRSKSVAFTGALLQDMAIPLLVRAQGDRYSALLHAWQQGAGALHELEQAELGWDHTTVAGWMGEHWSFPETLVQSIADHHGDARPPVVGVVALLECQDLEEGQERVVGAVVERLGASEKQARDWVARGLEEAGPIAAILRAA